MLTLGTHKPWISKFFLCFASDCDLGKRKAYTWYICWNINYIAFFPQAQVPEGVNMYICQLWTAFAAVHLCSPEKLKRTDMAIRKCANHHIRGGFISSLLSWLSLENLWGVNIELNLSCLSRSCIKFELLLYMKYWILVYSVQRWMYFES